MARRVLVVDDEEAILALIRDYFAGLGFDVICASDGEEGLRKLDSESPQVAIIDFLLPRKNGFALAEEIRKHPRHGQIPIIMMSGVFKNPKTAVEAREKYGVLDFLAKPFDLSRLESLVRHAVERRSSGLDLELPEDEALPLDAGGDGRSLFDSPMQIEPIAASLMPGARGTLGPSSRSSLPSATPRSLATEPPGRSSHPASRPAWAPPASTRARPVAGGRSLPQMPEQGDLLDLPVAMLLSIARCDRLTGMLDTSQDGTHRRIYVREGRPIFMQSNAEGENVGALLLRRGRITEPDYTRCVDHMRAEKKTMQRALLELRLASEQELATAYKLLAGQLLPAAIGIESGTFRWHVTDAFVGRVPEGDFSATGVILDGIRRYVDASTIERYFAGREDIPLERTDEFEVVLPAFQRAFSRAEIASAIDGRATYRELVDSRPNRPALASQLYALVTSGMVRLPPPMLESAAPPQRFASEDSLNLQLDDESAARETGEFSERDNEARSSIRRAHDQIMVQTFFELFSVPKGPSVDEQFLKECYFKLAKRWHADAFAGLSLGPEGSLLGDLFHRVSEAYETLNDPGKRQEYLVFLERKAKGLPTDVATVMQAESTFDDALLALRRKDVATARMLIKQALDMNPAEAIYHAYLGWVTYLLGRKSQAAQAQAVNFIKKAIQLQERLPVAYQFLGHIAQGKGNEAEAKRWYERCLEYDRSNIEAARGIRMLNQRSEREKRPSFLSIFLPKK